MQRIRTSITESDRTERRNPFLLQRRNSLVCKHLCYVESVSREPCFPVKLIAESRFSGRQGSTARNARSGRSLRSPESGRHQSNRLRMFEGHCVRSRRTIR